MLITVEDGQDSFDAPSDADFQIVLQSPFTQEELEDPTTTMVLEYRNARGQAGQLPAISVVTDIVVLVVPGDLAPAQYYINPKVTIAGKVRRWPRPLTMNIQDNFTPAPDCATC